MDGERIYRETEHCHPRYAWAFTGGSTWRIALDNALAWSSHVTFAKPIVYRSRHDGFWWATWDVWQAQP